MLRLFTIFAILVILIIFLASIGSKGFVFFEKFISKPSSVALNCPQVKQCSSDSFSFQPLPTTTEQSYPLVSKDKLILLSLQEGQKPTDTNINVRWGGGTIYMGNNQPISSPDLHKIAYIDKDNKLWLITPDGKNKVNVSPYLEAEYISGWSPDSKKLIVFSANNNTTSMFGGMDPAANLMRVFDRNRLPGGFYLIDTEQGTITSLFPITGFVEWIDSEQILAVENDYKEQFIIFNINDFSADAETLYQKFDNYFGKQFSFSADGTKWAISLANTGDSPGQINHSDIVIAKFPSLTGTKIAEGSWAEVQQPLLSPKGTKTIYINHSSSQPQWHVGIWDGSKISRIEDGRPQMWIDEDRFIYERSKEGGKKYVFEYNIPSSTERLLNP